MAYQQKITIYFDDCDPGGIVFFGNYYKLAHKVFEDYVRSLEIPWEHWFKNPKWVVPLRKSQAEYFQPLWAGQNYTFTVGIVKIGESSVTFEFKITNSQNALCSRLETTHVFVDPKKGRKMKVPADIKKRLQAQAVANKSKATTKAK